MTSLDQGHVANLLVAAPMERELSLLKGQLQDSTGVTFHTVGVGPERAYQGIRSLLMPTITIDRRQKSYRAVLLLGFAGAVDPSLKPGDLIISSKYYREPSTGDPLVTQTEPDFIEPDLQMLRRAVDAVQETALRFAESTSLTVGHVVDSPADKRAVLETYSVGSVNMEDYWAAAAAREANVPFISVRAVLDVASQRLPNYLPSLSVSGNRSVLSTLIRPWRITTLLRLAANMGQAQRSLAKFALCFIPKSSGLSPLASARSIPAPSSQDEGDPGRPVGCLDALGVFSGSIARWALGLVR